MDDKESDRVGPNGWIGIDDGLDDDVWGIRLMGGSGLGWGCWVGLGLGWLG